MGKIINGYELLMPFQSQNAGLSSWTTAKKDGKLFFIKQFISPVYPVDDSISEKLKNNIIEACKKYEDVSRILYETIGSVEDGNIVKIHEFFRFNSHYYITTESINSQKLSFEEIAALPLEDRLLLCKTLAHSVMQLHKKKVIHADIKADNVLIKKSQGGKLVCKLIDFDCGFIEDNQPKDSEELCGDQVYLSPEACMFMCGEDIRLTTKMDVFALGVLFHQYLTGEMPGFDRTECDYVHEAVLDEQELKLSDKLSEEHRELIKKMLICNPDDRCNAQEVFLALGGQIEAVSEEEDTDEEEAADKDNEANHEESAGEEDKDGKTGITPSNGLFMMPDENDLL